MTGKLQNQYKVHQSIGYKMLFNKAVNRIKGNSFIFVSSIFFSIAILLPHFTAAQITVTESDNSLNSPESLVKCILSGPGIEVVSINYIGHSMALGHFDGAEAYVGMESGLMLSTGNVNFLPSQGFGTMSYNFQSGPENYPDLNSGPANIFDLAALEITFIPDGNTIELDWVKGSEEYPAWMAIFHHFLDPFGIFLGGPGITGPYSNNSKRINTLPNGLPFSTATLHNNPSIFIENHQSTNPPFFNLFTIPFTATHSVIAGETYTLRIAIADFGDGIIDSGVLLKAGSFRVPGTSELPLEICNALMSPMLKCHNDADGTIDILIRGGVEPYTVTWDNGLEGTSINNLLAGVYGVTVTDSNNSSVSGSYEITAPEELVVTETITYDDTDGIGSISLSVSGGNPPYYYSWSNGANTPQISGLESGSYSVTVHDANLCQTFAGPFIIETEEELEDFEFSGNVYSFTDLSSGIGDVKILANGYKFTTGQDGSFSFSIPHDPNGVTLQIIHDVYPLHGITTLDGILIMQHVLGNSIFSDPLQKIAADLNNDRMLDVADIILLQKLIIGKRKDFIDAETNQKVNTSWRFAPEWMSFEEGGSFEVPSLPATFDFPASELENPVELNFTGIKIGDVNYSSSPFSLNALGDTHLENIQASEQHKLMMAEKLLSEHEAQIITIPFSLLEQISGFQFNMGWDKEKATISFTNIDKFEAQHGVQIQTKHDESQIQISVIGVLISEDLKMKIVPTHDVKLSELLISNNTALRSEVYAGNFETAILEFVFSPENDEENAGNKGNIFSIIYPNPASGDVQIEFNLSVNDHVLIKAFDASGKMLYSRDLEMLPEGGHTFNIPAYVFPASATYFIRIESESLNGVQKLIYKP